MCKKCYESHQYQKSFVSLQSKEHNKVMDVLNDIYTAIAAKGFTFETLQMIDNYANDIQNGKKDFSRFNLSEHAGLCKGGSPLIGASIIACYASASLRASCNAEGREGSLANWEIDEHHMHQANLC